jgi:predicted nucleotide-binding protein
MSRFEVSRVVQVLRDEPRTEVSGYLLAKGLILTAEHILYGHQNVCDSSISIKARILGNTEKTWFWQPVSVLWHQHAGTVNERRDGVALLRVPESPVEIQGEDFLGWSAEMSDSASVLAVGFPEFAIVRQGESYLADVHTVLGEVALYDGIRAGQLIIRTNSQTPRNISSWAGFSGAAVFAGERIVGIINWVSERGLHASRIDGLRRNHGFLAAIAGVASFASKPKQEPSRLEHTKMSDPRKVFVVHGRNDKARRAVFDLLRALDLWPLEWNEVASETGTGSPFIFEILQKGFEIAQAIVVILTPDELVEMRAELQNDDGDKAPRYQPRPNVLFEAGMAFMRDRSRTVLLEFGRMVQASDLSGVHALRVQKGQSTAIRKQLADRLISAGCAVSTAGQDWLNAGDFDAAFTD